MVNLYLAKINMSPEKGPFQKESSLQTQQMFVFGGCSCFVCIMGFITDTLQLKVRNVFVGTSLFREETFTKKTVVSTSAMLPAPLH